MNTIKKVLFDILTNPDNTSYSSKRVLGTLSFISTVTFGAVRYYEAMVVMAGLTTAFFGLSTIDNKTQVVAGNSDGKNP